MQDKETKLTNNLKLDTPIWMACKIQISDSLKRDFAIYNKVYAHYFKENQPCRTTVEINSLPTPIAIELKCIATIKES